jgi:hypothetical protein
MNRQLKEDKLMQMDLSKRVSKPSIRLFCMEKVRTDINKLAGSCITLSMNHELKELGHQFDELLNIYYKEEKASSL